MRWLGLFLVLGTSVALGVAACAAAPPTPANSPPAATETSTPVQAIPAAPSSAPAREPPQVSAVRLEPRAAQELEKLPHVEIRFPIAEQQIPIPKAQKYRVRLKVEDHVMKPGSAGVRFVLDDRLGRVVHDLRPVPLADVVEDGAKIEPGDHVLMAFAVDATGMSIKPPVESTRGPFAIVHFWVGAKGTPRFSATHPRVVHHAPRGTLNGEAAADAASLDFYLVGARLGVGAFGLEVQVHGPDGRAVHTRRLSTWSTHAVRGLESGDYRFQLSLLDSTGAPVAGAGAESTRTITVNRDAPVPGPTK